MLRIRHLRKKKGWRQKDLAEKVSISIPYLSVLERGVQRINGDLVTRIAHALDVVPSELFSEGSPSADDLELHTLHNALQKLNPESRSALISHVVNIAAQFEVAQEYTAGLTVEYFHKTLSAVNREELLARIYASAPELHPA